MIMVCNEIYKKNRLFNPLKVFCLNAQLFRMQIEACYFIVIHKDSQTEAPAAAAGQETYSCLPVYVPFSIYVRARMLATRTCTRERVLLL